MLSGNYCKVMGVLIPMRDLLLLQRQLILCTCTPLILAGVVGMVAAIMSRALP